MINTATSCSRSRKHTFRPQLRPHCALAVLPCTTAQRALYSYILSLTSAISCNVDIAYHEYLASYASNNPTNHASAALSSFTLARWPCSPSSHSCRLRVGFCTCSWTLPAVLEPLYKACKHLLQREGSSLIPFAGDDGFLP